MAGKEHWAQISDSALSESNVGNAESEKEGPGPSNPKKTCTCNVNIEKISDQSFLQQFVQLRQNCDDNGILNRLKKTFVETGHSVYTCLSSMDIRCCNASTGFGISFTKASCESILNDNAGFPFGSIFLPGMELLIKFFEDEKYVPDIDYQKVPLIQLLKYLLNCDAHKAMMSLQKAKTKADVEVILMKNFFSKLSMASSYTFDNNERSKILSSSFYSLYVQNSGFQYEDTHFGDTSIGLEEGWHGSLDIIFGNADVFICFCEEVDSEGKLREEVKLLNSKSYEKSQILAQTIVFSFLHQKRNPSSVNFMVPSIAVTRNEVQFFFYDCHNDILLECTPLPLFLKKNVINPKAVLGTWLVLNWKIFCSGPTEDILKVPKSNFHRWAGASLDLYCNEILFRNVQQIHRTQYDTEFYKRLHINIKWPEGLEKYDPKILEG